MTAAQPRQSSRRAGIGGGIPRGIRRDGPALLSYGFRPFFLGAGVFAPLAMALWIAALATGLPVGGDYGAVAWHGHEMLFGFGAAVLSGFLMTAIPNWTGKMPLSGRPLAALAGLWLAGRVAMLGAGWIGVTAAVTIDALFLPALLTACARELIAGGKWSELKVLGGVALITVANIGFHAEVLLTGAPGLAARAGVAGYALLVMIIGGRIVPSFTRNWLAARGETRLPVPFNRDDGISILLSLVALTLWLFVPEGPVAVAAGLAGLAIVAWRMARWRGAGTWREPLLLVLHVAFGFVGLGFLAMAAGGAGLMPPAAAMHVMMVGGMAGMMLAVMTRATRGHTGRPLTATLRTTAAYACLFAAALARPAADLLGAPRLLEAAAALFIAAFLLFLSEYGPMLVRPRAPRAD